MQHRNIAPVFYAFTGLKAPSPATLARICIGPEAFVERYFPRSELTSEMGGWVRYVRRSTGERWLGVWGARKSSRFRRILRERGAVFIVEAELPADIALSLAATGQKR